MKHLICGNTVDIYIFLAKWGCPDTVDTPPPNTPHGMPIVELRITMVHVFITYNKAESRLG